MSAGAVGTGENYFISSTDEKAAADAALSATAKDRVTHDEFLTLLTAQLTHQDPLNPMEDVDFIGQMAQLQALDSQIEMTTAVKSMRVDTRLQSGSAMIGKHITGNDRYDTAAAGIVQKVLVRDGEVLLELENMQRIPFEKVIDVREPTIEEVLG